jgi:hypothetical protein
VERGGRSLCRTASQRRTPARRDDRGVWREEALQEEGGGAPVESAARRAVACRQVLEIFFSASLSHSYNLLSAFPTLSPGAPSVRRADRAGAGRPLRFGGGAARAAFLH